jgi:predicted metalloprotease with PDZ domain
MTLRRPLFHMVAVVAAVLAGLAADAAGQAQRTPAEYQVSIAASSPLLARVRARLPVADGRLEMAGWGADMHPRGWAHYVHGLTVRDRRGRPIAAAAVPDSAVWRLGQPAPGVVDVEYTVDLSYAALPWPYGNEQASLYADGQLFTVSKALFVTSSATGPRRVEFSLPAGWHVAAPWAAVLGVPGAFDVRDRNSLINNSLVVGPVPPTTIRAGAFTFQLALLGPAASGRAEIEGALSPVLQEFIRIFPSTPPSQYLMTVFRAAEPDAEAYAASTAFSEAEDLLPDNRLGWAQTLAHELFHAWNGHAIHAASASDLQWFSEGVTDYYATRTLAKAGLIGESEFIRRMEHVLGRYLYFRSAPAFDGVTLRAAGTRKGTYRLGVYDGGWTIGLCLDMQIRTASRGSHSLDDVMRSLYERFGVPGTAVAYDDVVRTAAAATGTSWDDFFRRYVDGNETLPVADCLKQAGYRGFGQSYAGDYYVVPLDGGLLRDELFESAGVVR